MTRRHSKKDVTCPVTAYARAVVGGKIVAGRLVRLACERHLSDLKLGGKRGLVWDGDAARHAIQIDLEPERLVFIDETWPASPT